MAIATSFNTWLGMGRETTYGTGVASSVWVDILSSNLGLKIADVVPERLRSPSATERVEGKKSADGQIVTLGNYEGLEALFKDGFGSVATTTVNTSVSQHAFTLATALPSPGLSLEIPRDTSVQSFRSVGCKIESIEFSQDINDFLRVTFGIVAQGEDKLTASTPTFPTLRAVSAGHATFKLDTVAVDIRALKLTIANNLIADRGKLGSNLVLEPVRNGMRNVTGSFELDFTGTAQIYDKWVAGTAVALEVTWDSGVNIPSSSPQTNFNWVLACPAIKYSGETPELGKGILVQRAPFTAYQSAAANDECTLTLQGEVASVI